MKERFDQMIFSYSIDGKNTFHVLAQIIDKDQIKFSQLNDPIYQFQPVGKLGQKVHYLQKRTKSKPVLVVSSDN